jgi:transposase
MAAQQIALKAHMRIEELEEHYRGCKNAKEKTRWQVIWLYAQKVKTRQISKVTGFGRSWVYELVQRYNFEGPEGLIDKHRDNPGGDQRAILNEDEQLALMKAIQGKAPDGGLWTAPKVAAWVKQNTGKTLAHSTAWTYLRRLGLTLQVPRPSHEQEASPEEQAAFKKK